MSPERRPGPPTAVDGAADAAGADTGGPVLRIEQDGVSDIEVAAVTVAVSVLLAAPGDPGTPAAAPAWRRAGLWEASTARRVRSPAELVHTEAR